MWNDDSGALYLLKNDGFRGRFLVLSGVLRIVTNSGSSLFVSHCGLMAVIYGVFFLRHRCDRRVEWETLLLLHRCNLRVEWWLLLSGPGQAADLLYSGQCCDLFDHQGTHFSALGLLPVHTIICDGALGFTHPLEHVAAAALVSSSHSDLLVASGAKANEYMKESAAASVAAFLLDGQTDLLAASAAQAYHFFEHQSVT